MTIDEAIENLERQGIVRRHWMDKEGEAALQLGIKALERVRGARIDKRFMASMLLLGETEN